MAPAADDASSFPEAEAASASTRVRCAAVMIRNTGSAAARWWWNEPAGAATRILTSPAAPTASRGGGLARGRKAPEAGRQRGGAVIEAEREVVTVEEGQKKTISPFHEGKVVFLHLVTAENILFIWHSVLQDQTVFLRCDGN